MNRYSIILKKVDGEYYFSLQRGEEVIGSISHFESRKIKKPIGVYLLNKNNISFEETNYSYN